MIFFSPLKTCLFKQKAKGKKSLKMVAAGELKKVKSSGSRVDEMLKRSETADDIAAFGRLHMEDAQATGYFDAEKNEWVEGDAKSARGRSKVSAVRSI